jgi:DNA replication and repair protein RecF
MSLRRLRIQELRNIHDAELDLARVNVFAGANGSGKTSILEAVYLLGSGRSFRSSRREPVINHEASGCVVHALVSDAQHASPLSIGVARRRDGEFEGRIQGRTVQNTAELARCLPVQLINSDSFDLLEGGPKSRRQFLDWGVFHVEQEFHGVWLDVQRVLRQRNALIRHARIAPDQLEAWDTRLSASAERLDGFRRQYFEAFYPQFTATLADLANIEGIELSYQRGWDKERGLLEVLRDQHDRDRERGFTVSGPHRADIRLRLHGQSADEVLSRGQQKLVVCAMKVAQARIFTVARGRACVFLVDDLPAELDRKHRQALCSLLSSLNCQVMVSCVERSDLEDCWPLVPPDELRLFHVEQGLSGGTVV